MKENKNIPYYLIIVGLFIALKFGFRLLDNSDLIFLLKPVNELLEILTGSHAIFLLDEGYYHETLNICIEKSCSGFDFWMLSFVLFSYLFIKNIYKPIHKILAIPLAFISTYGLTIFVNTSRIFASIIVHAHTKNILPNQQSMIHESVGIITNLTFLVLAYILIEETSKNSKIRGVNKYKYRSLP